MSDILTAFFFLKNSLDGEIIRIEFIISTTISHLMTRLHTEDGQINQI